MPANAIRVSVCEKPLRPPPAEIAEMLARQGFPCEITDEACSKGPVVLLFGAFSVGVCERLKNLSHDGFVRVLAVAGGAASMRERDAWELLRAGASDVLVWDELESPVDAIVARLRRWISVEKQLVSPMVHENLVGKSRTWLTVLRDIIEVARWSDASLLLVGESGTGKELVARLVHALDQRPDKGDLVLLDCSTIVPELSGSEFFGHERGAFTGAVAAREGAFALADRGTLFLDEVGELPVRLQAELLRVIQERTYKPVGGNAWRRTSFRLICATNRDLASECTHGGFRADLYYRLAGATCRLPNLNERRDDIPLLVNHFLRQLRPQREPPGVHPLVWRYLLGREYPGNVRELRQLITRIVARYPDAGPITIGAIPGDDFAPAGLFDGLAHDATLHQFVRAQLAGERGLDELKEALVDAAYGIAIQESAGDTALAARRLKVTQRAVQMRIRDGRIASAPEPTTG